MKPFLSVSPTITTCHTYHVHRYSRIHISDQFSQAEVPSAYKVILMLEGLEHKLQNLKNDCEVPDVIHIAAQAVLIMVGKYYALMDVCEVYHISSSES